MPHADIEGLPLLAAIIEEHIAVTLAAPLIYCLHILPIIRDNHAAMEHCLPPRAMRHC
jgi:hypothetical protein